MMIFKKTILTDRDASIALIFEALDFFRHIKNEGYVKDVSEFDVRLVLDEALENAICHGNGCNPKKTISVCLKGYKRKISIKIQDQGTGFNPEQATYINHTRDKYALHGRGLTLLSHLGSVKWNNEGNCVMVEVY